MIATSSVAMSEISSLPTNCSVMTRRRDSSNNNLNLNEIAGGSLNNSCGTEQGSFLPRGSNSVTSLVKLASSNYFHPGLLSTAQTYSCLTSSASNTVGNNTPLVGNNNIALTTGNAAAIDRGTKHTFAAETTLGPDFATGWTNIRKKKLRSRAAQAVPRQAVAKLSTWIEEALDEQSVQCIYESEVPVVPNILRERENLPDLSNINNSSFSMSDLATITEHLTLDKDKSLNNYISCSTRSPGCGTTSLGSFSQQESIISTEDKASNLNEANNKINLCNSMSNFDISSSNNAGGITCDITASKKMSSKSNILGNNRKSSSTSSIPEATGGNHNHRNPISSNYQAASAENLTWNQSVEEISVNVLSNARSDLAGIGSEFEHIDNVPAEVPAIPNILRERENLPDLH
ncbi:unnamed protein product [Diamesa hyperborea]